MSVRMCLRTWLLDSIACTGHRGGPVARRSVFIEVTMEFTITWRGVDVQSMLGLTKTIKTDTTRVVHRWMFGRGSAGSNSFGHCSHPSTDGRG
jgi:hypothetical protein